jgi:hypothetical protein
MGMDTETARRLKPNRAVTIPHLPAKTALDSATADILGDYEDENWPHASDDEIAPPLPARPVFETKEAENSKDAKEKSVWQTAFDETRYFAGGLISHPYESTKHFSIIRHTNGLVWYRGPSTSVAITILSDGALPPGRSIWLQRKGFSGNMGMNLSALVGTNGRWLDLTPLVQAHAEEAPEVDERGWQRDMKRFAKKATKELTKHAPRETHVVRIPAAAADGYFRLLLCAGEEGKKKVLCPSPVFRIASTSTDASVLRGAGIRTMPLEVGVKVASKIGATALNTAISTAVSPVASVVQSKVQSKIQTFQPTFSSRQAGYLAYGRSGLGGTIAGLSQRYESGAGYGALIPEGSFVSGTGPEVVGPDSGPEKPFPVKFHGRVAKGLRTGGGYRDVPIAELVGVPDDIRMRMKGVLFGWACIVAAKGMESVSHEWNEAIISIGPSDAATPTVLAKNIVDIHLIHDFANEAFFNAKMKIVLMGYLRPVSEPGISREEHFFSFSQDVDVAVASLSRDNWGPEHTIRKMRTVKSERNMSERYVDAREAAQKRIDRIPMHWAGVRTVGAALRDEVHGNGGFWIQR